MKFLIVLAVAFLAVNADTANQYCYKDAQNACTQDKNVGIPHCTAKYGGITDTLTKLQEFANTHLMRSYEYLLVSTHFSNYKINREGFAKVFRKLSDATWEDTINIIKYITKRGGSHDFDVKKQPDDLNTVQDGGVYEQVELNSLSRAVDVQKSLAKDAIDIHRAVTRKHEHDPEIANYIEEEFAEKHAEQIRKLVGHVSDLSKMLSPDAKDAALALHLFDEFLQKE